MKIISHLIGDGGMLLSFIILTRNSDKYISACIASIHNSVPPEINKEILIVDNGSADRTLEILKTHDNIRLFELPRNFGTTYSRNLALRCCSGAYIVIMDSDIEIKRIDWVAILKQFIGTIGLLAPRLNYADGVRQHSVKRFPTFHQRLKKLKKIFLGISILDTELYENIEDTIFPDTAISAFWILPKHVVDKVGLFDENIFYSPEDVDYCVRLWKSGYAIRYYQDTNIVHHTQRIAHKRPISFISLTFLINFIYYFAKHRYFFNTKKIDNIKAEVLGKLS